MMRDWGADQLSRDKFLGGQLEIQQPKQGYRAGVDPVLLAASVPAVSGQSVLELGCGAGVASLCLARRVPGINLTGLEIQPEYASLARRNATENKIAMEIFTCDLSDLPASLREIQFDHVIANPPYFNREAGTAASEPGREIALGGPTPIDAWISCAAKRCKPKGYVTFIQRADRLPELLNAVELRLGGIEVLPLIPRIGRAAKLVLLRGRKGGRAEFRLHDSWVLHAGAEHDSDRENYTKATACVLRDGVPLHFSG